MNRRTMLQMVATAAAHAVSSASARAQAPAAAASDINSKLRTLAAANRFPLTRDGEVFSGPGWDWLLAESKQSRFTAVGEEHGLAVIPQATSALYKAAEYERLSVEISPPTAQRMDTVLSQGGLSKFSTVFGAAPISVAFYSNQEDAALLATVRATSTDPHPVIWGTDYEVANDRTLLRELATLAPPGAAKDIAREILAASEQSWDKAMATKNPGLIWTFCGDPALFDRLRAAWPQPDPDSTSIIDCLQRTLRINALWLAGDAFGSNQLRATWQRQNFLRYIHTEKLAGRNPRVLFRYGEEHVLRGVSQMGGFDLGSLIGELAAIDGGTSFHLMMIAGHGSTRAALDPTVLAYKPVPSNGSAYPWLQPFVESASEGTTVFNLRPLRPFVADIANRASTALLRTIIGYDALVIFPNAKPATPFPANSGL
ncbi:MAG: hypothetical protein M3O31_14585 [Acidobacteriota bacterium]|nr:hypothetical protein [Acidobacteriota bacterium]